MLLLPSILCELDDCIDNINVEYPGVEPDVYFPRLDSWANRTSADRQAARVEQQKREHRENQHYELLKFFMSNVDEDDNRKKRSIKEIAVDDERPYAKKAKTDKIKSRKSISLFETVDVDLLIPPMKLMKLSNDETAAAARVLKRIGRK